MKKITFILIALVSGTAFAQATADGTATANIVSPIEILEGADLVFGDITSNQGVVVVTPEGYDAGATTANVVGVTTPSPASFTVTAADQFSYTVTLPSLVVLEATGGATMTLNNLEDNSSGMGSGLGEEFQVGGTLYVANGQATGNYEGTITVSVAYE